MFSDPRKNLEQLALQPGSRVADFGSGAGFYALAAARFVGDRGRVYAIDVMKDMLTKLKNEAHRLHLHNIEALWGNIEKLGGSRLAPATVDVVLLCNTLFQLEHKHEVALEAKRILKPKGKVLVLDWKDSYGGLGPQP